MAACKFLIDPHPLVCPIRATHAIEAIRCHPGFQLGTGNARDCVQEKQGMKLGVIQVALFDKHKALVTLWCSHHEQNKSHQSDSTDCEITLR